MPLTCFSCFPIKNDSRSSVAKIDDGTSPCSTRAPIVLEEEFSDAVSEETGPSYESRLAYFRQLCSDPSFLLESATSNSPDGIEISYKPRKNDPLIARGKMHASGWFPHNLAQISDLILDTSKRHLWDSDLYEIEILERTSISDSETLLRVWASFKGRFGFPGRDFFWDIYILVSEDEIVHVTMPGEDDGVNRHNGRFVRGQTLLGGLRIVRTPEGVDMTLINQTDAGGRRLVPDWVIDSVMKKSPQKLGAIKKFILENTSLYTSI